MFSLSSKLIVHCRRRYTGDMANTVSPSGTFQPVRQLQDAGQIPRAGVVNPLDGLTGFAEAIRTA